MAVRRGHADHHGVRAAIVVEPEHVLALPAPLDVTLVDKQPSAMRVASVADAEWILADACELPSLEQAKASAPASTPRGVSTRAISSGERGDRRSSRQRDRMVGSSRAG